MHTMDQSYIEKDFFCLKPPKRDVVTLLKLQKIYILNPKYKQTTFFYF